MTKKGCHNCSTTAPENLVANPAADDGYVRPSFGPKSEFPDVCKEDCKPRIRVEIPKYAFVYPNFDRIKLATIKDSIHHPRVPAVPSFRRVDRDDQLKRLPDEHVRTSVPCGKEFYKRSADSRQTIPPGVETVIRKTPPHPGIYDPHLVMICPEIKEGRAPSRSFAGDPTGSKLKVEFIRNPPKPRVFPSNNFSQKEWRQFLDQDPSTYQLTPPKAPLTCEQHWVGHGVTYQKLDNGDPHMKSRQRWRRSLKGYPNTWTNGQRPLPSNTLDLFRRPAEGHETKGWTPPVSTEVWKPQHYYFDNTDPMQRLTSGPPSRPFELECRQKTRVTYDRGLHTTN